MNAVKLLSLPAETQYTEEQESQLARELAQAYWLDECAGTNPVVLRLSEKVRLRMSETEAAESLTQEEPES